jgi:uncharacterized protein
MTPKLKRIGKIASQTLVTLGLSTVLAGHSQADSFTDFFRAIELDRPAVVQQLIERGFPVNAVNAYGQPSFVLALRTPSPQVAEVLWTARGFDIHQTTTAGETPLMIAALIGDEAWIRRLIERGSRLDSDVGWTALHYAASGQSPAALALILARRPPLDIAAPNGNTALMMAARFGDERHAEALLSVGADPRLKNKAGASAADLARDQGRDRLAERLARAAASRPDSSRPDTKSR